MNAMKSEKTTLYAEINFRSHKTAFCFSLSAALRLRRDPFRVRYLILKADYSARSV